MSDETQAVLDRVRAVVARRDAGLMHRDYDLEGVESEEILWGDLRTLLATVDALREDARCEREKIEAWALDRMNELGPQPDLRKSDSERYAWAGKATAYDNLLCYLSSSDAPRTPTPEGR